MVDETQNLRGDAGGTDADPEKTLVAPRFDAREVVTAQPVVPLGGAQPPRPARRQGTLPLVLILISALVGGLVSVLAYRFYQQRAGQSSAREQQLPTIDAPPVTPALAPSPETSAAAETSATPEVIEEPQPDMEVAEVREAEATDEEAARAEAREDRDGRDPDSAGQREARAEQPAARSDATRRPTARRVEEITTPTEDLRVRRERYDGKEASDYEVPRRTPRAERRAERRAARRAARRDGERNIDRVRAIFEGPPPGQ